MSSVLTPLPKSFSIGWLVADIELFTVEDGHERMALLDQGMFQIVSISSNT